LPKGQDRSNRGLGNSIKTKSSISRKKEFQGGETFRGEKQPGGMTSCHEKNSFTLKNGVRKEHQNYAHMGPEQERGPQSSAAKEDRCHKWLKKKAHEHPENHLDK